ncbi:DUF4030 domain-containing protein [Bacillus tuaregi]|uniref:DUF4030 domain-containing protein n=1 Tax=Bacillus tuaregi TaxID=1816695 RepID=UPI0008F7F382|nr:DUF4030 domain-containing protein [Bacillus tuaregi]
MKKSIYDIKKEIDEISIPEAKLNQTIEKAISRGRKKNLSLSKKIVYGCSAAVILFGLLVSSAFVSPVMAEVVSKIPFLGQLITTKSIGSVVSEELKEKGYHVAGIGVSFQGQKEISIEIEGSENYFNQVKDEVEKIVDDILKLREYDAYTIKVSRSKEFEQKVSESDRKRMETVQFLHNAITQELEKHHYTPLMLMFTKETINLELPNTISDEEVQDIKQIISDVLAANNAGTYSVKVKKIDMEKREQEGRWAEILQAVGEDLMGKKEYKVTGLAYSVYPSPELIIKTSIKSEDQDAKEFAGNLEVVIEEFLKNEEMVSLVENDSYIITIRSKDGKKIN